jgi:enoyl-CoA hydratase
MTLVRTEERGEVALVTIDRPPANAMDLELLEAGRLVLQELEDSDPGAVVLTGREGFFSAGVDLKVAPALDAAGQRAMVEGINSLFAGWYSFPRPVVAAVNGHAIAGGLILALCADHRVGGGDAKLGLTELRAGIGYPLAAIAIVKAELTGPAARELVLRAELVGPDEALALGALDEVVPPDEVLPAHCRSPKTWRAFPARPTGGSSISCAARRSSRWPGPARTRCSSRGWRPRPARPPRAS